MRSAVRVPRPTSRGGGSRKGHAATVGAAAAVETDAAAAAAASSAGGEEGAPNRLPLLLLLPLLPPQRATAAAPVPVMGSPPSWTENGWKRRTSVTAATGAARAGTRGGPPSSRMGGPASGAGAAMDNVDGAGVDVVDNAVAGVAGVDDADDMGRSVALREKRTRDGSAGELGQAIHRDQPRGISGFGHGESAGQRECTLRCAIKLYIEITNYADAESVSDGQTLCNPSETKREAVLAPSALAGRIVTQREKWMAPRGRHVRGPVQARSFAQSSPHLRN